MGFFDLNIPYSESDKHIPDKPTRKTTRLKLIIKAMELGYTGVAYNHTIKGVMSESDRCPIPLFPLSSLLKLSPALSTAVSLHRQLLGVPLSTPFRQYKRITVIVDTPSQASALNSGNPVLKTYDIVAVRPVNQNSFEQACQTAQVDLIAIDFSEKLPFRLKQHNVKAAIERGVYFEITYSGLVIDAQVRRQMICSAKLLVDWTRGKNLIFSSAAPSVTELRGPYDVANLSSLLGIPMERAKAAISKNCRTLIANALRKKQFYKEAIRVEVISSGEQLDSSRSGFDDWLKWDPISSGEGDLLLEEMEKSFRASSIVFKTVKAIDFASVVDGLPSHGLQIKDIISTKTVSEPPNTGKNFSAHTVSDQPQRHIFLDGDQTCFGKCSVKQDLPLDEMEKSFLASSEVSETVKAIDSRGLQIKDVISAIAASEPPDTGKNFSTHAVSDQPERLDTLDRDQPVLSKCSVKQQTDEVTPIETEVSNFESQNHTTVCETHVILPDDNAIVQTLAQNTIAAANNDIATPSEDIVFSASIIEESKSLNRSDVVMGESNIVIDEQVMLDDYPTIEISVNNTEIPPSKDVQNVSVDQMTDIRSKLDFSMASCLVGGSLEVQQFTETEDGPVTLADDLPVCELDDAMQNKTNCSVANNEAPMEVTMQERSEYKDHRRVNSSTLGEVISGKPRLKRRASYRPLFPFKRLLSPIPNKKKALKFKRRRL